MKSIISKQLIKSINNKCAEIMKKESLDRIINPHEDQLTSFTKMHGTLKKTFILLDKRSIINIVNNPFLN